MMLIHAFRVGIVGMPILLNDSHQNLEFASRIHIPKNWLYVEALKITYMEHHY